MAKKKQPDFQKTKLRVGRTLPKGRNVTDTSFKTRKIVTRDQLRVDPGDMPLKDLLSYLGHNNVSTKKEYLNKLKNYVLVNQDTLSLFFTNVLKRVGRILLEDEASVRHLAMEVMQTSLILLSDVQVECFLSILTSHLKCMMTHINNAIRKDSLRFLDKILDSHPTIICRSVEILTKLLDLISSHEKDLTRGIKRKLNEHISSSITSQEYRTEVLKRVHVFLECTFTVDEREEEENEVHWDGEKPLYLPLYLRGGMTPVPLESLNVTSDLQSTNSKVFRDFVYDLVPLLSEVINGEISSKQFRSNSTVDQTVVRHLNVVVRILCCLSEWLHHKLCSNDVQDKSFKKLLDVIVCRQLMKRFPYSQHDVSYIKKRNEKKSQSECIQLNLGVCYLYSLLIKDDQVKEREKAIIHYLKDLFLVCNSMCDESISLMIKICKILISSKINTTYKNGILCGLHSVLEVHKHSSSAKSLYEFFMDVSLNYDFKYLLDCEGLRTWFSVILKEVVLMMESGDVNYRFLKYIRQICARKYSYFLEILNKAKSEDLLDLLKYEDEELQLTVIHLICSLNQPEELLQDIGEILSDSSFSTKTASRMIYLLHSRFSGPDVPARNKLLFLRFLLNLGCDTYILTDPSLEANEEDSDVLQILQSCPFEVYPSSKWERHLKLTKVCFECLQTYMQIEPFADSTIVFLKTILVEHQKLPIHCVIAFLKLRKVTYEMYDDEHLIQLYSELIFSCGMYLSVLLIDHKEEDQESYAIPELQKSLELERGDATYMIDVINSVSYDFGVGEMYHALRFTLFLIRANIIQLEDRDSFFAIIEKIHPTCESSKLLQPLCMHICKFFQFI